MMFKKKPPAQPERARRSPQQPANRSVVFSYYANRAPRAGTPSRDMQAQQEKPERIRPKRNWTKAAPNIIIAGGVLVLAVFSLQLNANVHIKTTDGNDANVFLRDESTYQAAASEAFAHALNRNKLTVNTDDIAAQLTRQFPEIDAASVSLPFFGNRPTVYIQAAQPTLILSTQSNGLYVLDGSGRALIAGTQAASLDRLKLPVVADESGLAIRTGKVALPKATVQFIDEVVYQLRQKDITITSLTLPAGTSELHVKMDGVGYFVKFNLYGDAREEAGALIALKQQLEKSKKTPKEYIDVRVEGRVYYK
jgi:hypothetical protein